MATRWFLITWTTRGSWLPGDPRGFRTYKHKFDVAPPKRYAGEGKEYDQRNWRGLFEYSRGVSKGEVNLSTKHQDIVKKRIIEISERCGCEITTVHVGPKHVHVLACPGAMDISDVIKRIKGNTSRELSDHGLKGSVWSRGYHMRIVPPKEISKAQQYLKKHS